MDPETAGMGVTVCGFVVFMVARSMPDRYRLAGAALSLLGTVGMLGFGLALYASGAGTVTFFGHAVSKDFFLIVVGGLALLGLAQTAAAIKAPRR